MTKIVVSRVVEMVGSQILVFAAGVMFGFAAHVFFGMTAEHAADVTLMAQMLQAGWVIRGWF